MQLSYFLGANSSKGFYSLFNELYYPDDDWKMFIIKGGPGTGKSSLMKRIAAEAEKRNLTTEHIYCSSDPLSLDAVIIPEIKVSIADGTKPHTIEPIYPGIVEHIINLGDYWDTDILINNAVNIKNISKQNSYYHKKSIKYLKAYSIIDNEISDEINKCFISEKADRFVIRYCEQLSATEKDKNKTQKRFLSAVTHKGISVNYKSFINMCDDIVTIKDKTPVVSNYILRKIINITDQLNIDKIIFTCPVNPDKIEHIIFPNVKKGIFTSNSYHPNPDTESRTIRFDRFINKEQYNKIKNKLIFLNKAKMELIGETVKCLEQAKNTHDILESYYIPAMNFNKITQITENLINTIFE